MDSTIYIHFDNTCKPCCGSGMQTRYDGIRVYCPECNGSGVRQFAPYTPITPWVPQQPNPWFKQPYEVGDFPGTAPYIGDMPLTVTTTGGNTTVRAH